MNKTTILKPFSTPFLSQFLFAPNILPFKNEEIISLDKELSTYEQVFMSPEIEQSLISKNELLASFAISKAENSQLTLQEAQNVYNLILNNPDYDFVGTKLKSKQTLTQKDHDQLEFFNIAKTFRLINQKTWSIHDMNPNILLDIHRELTQGLDIFKKYLSDFTVYNAGEWRDNDSIRVGDYIPAPHTEIKRGINELITYLKSHQTIVSIAVFHTALYGLHPFNNGNKRVCRILEHVLLRSVGLNIKNLYSTSYYYHTQKPRYYKQLLYSLKRKNLNHFVSFVLEALTLSIVSVLKTSLEVKRGEYLNKQELEIAGKTVLKPLIKRRELQFKHLARFAKGKMARQTLVNYLQRAVEEKIVTRKKAGRTTYYSFNLTFSEYETLQKWLTFVHERLNFIPDDFRLT